MAAGLLNSAQVFADGVQIETKPARVLKTRFSDFFNNRVCHFSSPKNSSGVR